MIGGIFVTPDWVAKNAHGSFWFQRRVGNAVMCCEIDPNALDVHLKGPGKMGRKLSTYSAALLVDRVRDDVEETVIALYYPDQANAERDVPQELKKQWDGFYANLDAKASVSDSCSPLSGRIVKQKEAYVLVETCGVVRGISGSGKAKGPNLWRSLFFERKLEFLAPDLEAQKRGVEKRLKK